MRTVFEHSHFGGSEILLVRYPDINALLEQAISSVKVPAAGARGTTPGLGEPHCSPADISAQVHLVDADPFGDAALSPTPSAVANPLG